MALSERTKRFRANMVKAAGATRAYDTFLDLIRLYRNENDGPDINTLWQDICKAYRNRLLSDSEYDKLLSKMPKTSCEKPAEA